jgi:hypothetical protein
MKWLSECEDVPEFQVGLGPWGCAIVSKSWIERRAEAIDESLSVSRKKKNESFRGKYHSKIAYVANAATWHPVATRNTPLPATLTAVERTVKS